MVKCASLLIFCLPCHAVSTCPATLWGPWAWGLGVIQPAVANTGMPSEATTVLGCRTLHASTTRQWFASLARCCSRQEPEGFTAHTSFCYRCYGFDSLEYQINILCVTVPPAGQLAFDSTLPAVRVAVLEGLLLLVDNQHAQPVLKVGGGWGDACLPACLNKNVTLLPESRSTMPL